MPEGFNSVRALLLDIDGTIFSSEGILPGTYQSEFIKYNKERGRPAQIPGVPDIMRHIGKPVVDIFHNLAPDLTQDEQDELSGRILDALVKTIKEGGGHHYPGVRDTVRTLSERGYQIFAASNGRYPYIDAILRAQEIRQYFTGVPFLDNVRIRNKVELVSHVLETNSLRPVQAAVVGDRFSDREAAQKNGCFFAACRYGHGSEEELAGASVYIDSFSGLLDYFPGY